MMMNCVDETVSQTKNPFSGMPLFFISDPPYLMKKLRNNIYNSGCKDISPRYTRYLLLNSKPTVLLRNNLTENASGTRSPMRSICVPFAFHLRSVRVPFAFHLRSNLRSTITGTHPETRSCNTRNKIGYHRQLPRLPV